MWLAQAVHDPSALHRSRSAVRDPDRYEAMKERYKWWWNGD